MKERFTYHKLLYSKIDKSLLAPEIISILDLYLNDSLSQKEIALVKHQPLYKIRNEIHRALFELGKAGHDPEYIKARKIFYPGKYDSDNEK